MKNVFQRKEGVSGAGFTLLEILLVVGAIALLAGIVVSAMTQN